MVYKGYIGHLSFDEKLELFQEKVSNIHDLVTFQGKSIETLQQNFHNAINEYIHWCKKHGKEPETPSSEINSVSQKTLHSH
jgi:predicted HicB family RNase H-like nuclease